MLQTGVDPAKAELTFANNTMQKTHHANLKTIQLFFLSIIPAFFISTILPHLRIYPELNVKEH